MRCVSHCCSAACGVERSLNAVVAAVRCNGQGCSVSTPTSAGAHAPSTTRVPYALASQPPHVLVSSPLSGCPDGAAAAASAAATAASPHLQPDSAPVDSLRPLVRVSSSNMRDLRTIASGGWVVLSESAQFFTIGKVAVAVIEQIYDMWNAWSNKSAWVGEFIAFIKLVELDLVAGMRSFEHVHFLCALETQLESTRRVLHGIQNRPPALAFLMAMSDEASLRSQRELIESRKQECLFGHVIDVKQETRESIDLMGEIGRLVAERTAVYRELQSCPEGTLERERRMDELSRSFGMIDPTSDVDRYQTMWIVHQRRKKLRRMNDEERAAYVEEYLASAIRYVPSSESELRIALEDESHLAAATTPEDRQQRRNQAYQIAQRERDSFAALNETDRVLQVDSLRAAWSVALTSAEDRRNSCGESRFRFLAANRLLESWRAIDLPDDLSPPPSHLVQLVADAHQLQVEQGSALPPTPSLDDLTRFTRVGSSSERALYVREFQAYYRSELVDLEWLVDVAPSLDGSVRAADRPTKGKLLVIKAPPTSDSAHEPWSTPTKDLTCSIFLAFLVSIYPSVFRAVHFTPDVSPVVQPDAAEATAAVADDSCDRRDLRRIFPSLAFQLAQRADCRPYYDNLLENERNLTREVFDSYEAGDFVADLLGAQFDSQGRRQHNPNEATRGDSDHTEHGSSSPPKVCVAVDAPHFAHSRAANADGEFNPHLLRAITNQLHSCLPDWLCLVLTVPHRSKLDRRLPDHRPLQLTKPAMDDNED